MELCTSSGISNCHSNKELMGKGKVPQNIMIKNKCFQSMTRRIY